MTKAAPYIVKGGIMICEDQGHTPYLAGSYLAVKEFMDTDDGKKFLPIHMASGQMFFVRTH